jgi:hypothetical protein
MVQLGVQPQMRKRKLLRISPPRGVCTTSGWNCTPQNLRAGASTTANGQLVLVPSREKPAGSASTRSPWLIQTPSSSPGSKPASKVDVASSFTVARPYSRCWAGATLPPRSRLASCTP